MSNFLFLQKSDPNLFKIILDAEKLFRDEYFEQTAVQARRFAENICKDMLNDKISSEDNFDSMINKLKDNSFGNERMKEFVDDLYFLKRHGNLSAHSGTSVNNGEIALECLERAYEISVFYSNTKYGYSKKLDKSLFSEELLMTGKKTAQSTLKQRYSSELKSSRKQCSSTSAKVKTIKKTCAASAKKDFKEILSTIFNISATAFLVVLTFAYLYSCLLK